MLTTQETRALRWITKRHNAVIAAGFAIFFVGGLYGVWAVGQLDPEHAPVPEAAFDRPIARLAELFRGRDPLERIETETELEETLVTALSGERDRTARLVVLLLRLVMSSFFATLGIAALTWGLGARTFSRILGRVIEARERVAPVAEPDHTV